MRDYSVSCLDKTWVYFNVVGTKQNIDNLVRCATPDFQKKVAWRGAQPQIWVKQDNYLIDTVLDVDGTPVPRKSSLRSYNVSAFYKAYHDVWALTDVEQLPGVARLIYPGIEYPFR